MNSETMKRALNEVQESAGSNVVHVAFCPTQNNMAWQVWRHPEKYRLIKCGYDGQDIYVEYCMNRGYDKHFWVLVSEVEAIKAHYEAKAKS